MPIFEYQATDQEGRIVRGTIAGASLDVAAKEVSKRGLSVRNIGLAEVPGDPVRETAPPKPAVQPPRSAVQTAIIGPLIGKVPLVQIQFFFRQLASMLGAGVNPVQSLETLSSQTQGSKLSKIILEMRDAAQGGHPISAAMQRYPEVFTPMMMSLVRAGETGGFLEDSLKQTAEYIGNEIELRNLIRRETFYPKLVIGSALVIITGANAVIASVAPGSSGMWNPFAQASLMIPLIVLAVGAFLFFRVGLQNPRIRYWWDMFVLKIPWLGKTVHGFAMAKFGRAFGALYRGGVPIHTGLRLAADSCGNEYVRANIHPALARIEEGGGITETLRSSGAFSPIVLDMMATGENTGQLDQMLTKMAEYYEDEGKTSSRQMGMILGVIALLVVAIFVLMILIRFYSGYFGGLMQAADPEK